jgi:hypothetical protein
MGKLIPQLVTTRGPMPISFPRIRQLDHPGRYKRAFAKGVSDDVLATVCRRSLILGASLLTESRARSATQTPATEPQKQKPGVNQKSKTADQEPDPQKVRAVQLLREALDSSSTIENVGERSLLVSRAAELIWSQDQPLARFTLSKTFQDLLAQYKASSLLSLWPRRCPLN